jgi:hypothetical protein
MFFSASRSGLLPFGLLDLEDGYARFLFLGLLET